MEDWVVDRKTGKSHPHVYKLLESVQKLSGEPLKEYAAGVLLFSY
jgi:hypothetical protein